MRRVLLCLLFLFASPVFANSKSLFINGVYAATYGDIGYDKGDFQGNNFSAVRLKAGIQIIRIDFVGLTLGFQKVGFYDGLQKWSGDNKVKFDYRGPVLEAHFFPEAPVGFSFAGMSGNGYSYSRSEELYQYPACVGCKIDSERSNLKVGEFSGYVTVKIARGLQLIGGIGTRTVKGSPSYDVDRDGVHTFEKGAKEDWKESNSFVLVGLRGTTL